MTNLNCTVKSCANNRSDLCCRPDITVGGKSACNCTETCCDSYARLSKATNSATNSTGQSGYDIPNRKLNVACEATKCKFNTANMCSAEEISVKNGSHGTECASFRLR